jgi:hypothetical protein
VAVGGIPIFCGLAAIFNGLEFAGLFYLTRFAGERPGNNSRLFEHPISVHRCGMGPASGGIYLQNMPLIIFFTPTLRKMKFELIRWLANSPPNTNQYFSGLKEASIRHESLYIEKNILVHD